MKQPSIQHRLVLATTIVIAVGFASWLTSAVGQQLASQRRIASVKGCLASLIDDVEISAEETGKLLSVEIEEGHDVEADQLIAKIDDTQAKLALFAAERELKAATEQASDDIEIRFARASFEVADAELKQSLEINARSPGSVPESEVTRQRLARKRAELQIDRAELESRVAQMTAEIKQAEVDAATAGIERRQIHAPLSGFAMELLRKPGEWVQAGQPIARVIGLERLNVEGFVSSREFNPGELAGQRAIVVCELARGQRVELRGHVTMVSPLVQGGDRLRVRVEAENQQIDGQWVLRPGMNAELMIAAE